MVQATFHCSKTGRWARFSFDSNKAKWEIAQSGKKNKYFLFYKKAVKFYDKIVKRLENEAI